MGLISALVSAVGLSILIPLLFGLSMIIVPIAILTTTLAGFALGFRFVYIYVELFFTITTDYLTGRKSYSARHHARSSVETTSVPRTKSARSVSSSTGSMTPQAPTPGQVYSSNPLGRDFEGIGGWRISAEEDDAGEDQWLTMNSRLELPAVSAVAPEERKRHHQRRSTTSSMNLDRANFRKSSRLSRPSSTVISGTATPDPTLGGHGRVNSMTIMSNSLAGPRRGKSLQRKSSDSSSGSGNTLVV